MSPIHKKEILGLCYNKTEYELKWLIINNLNNAC